MRPGENQNYRGMSPLGEEGSLEARPILDPQTSPQPATQPVAAPTTPQTLLHLNKWAIIATGVLLTLIVVIGFAMLWSVGFKSNQQARQPASEYEDKNLALDDISQDDLLQVSQAAKLNINGELQVGNTFILTPTSTPSTPKAGQIYYDKRTNTPYVYNGSSFVSMIDAPAVQSLGGITGVIGLGNGLQLSNGQLSVSAALQQSIGVRVTTVQGQSGDITFTAGNGIAVNGTTISNTGLTQLAGGNGLLVTQSGGLATVTLPQLLGAGNSPTFANVQLSNALSLASGGTNTNGGAFISGGLFFFNGTSFATTAAPGSNGLCLLSGPSGPYFDSCSGASAGVSSLNGANGTLILDNATANTTTGHITIQDAGTAQKGIAQFDGADFDVAAGTVTLDATVTQAGNVFNGSDQLVRLDAGGQSTGTGQCLMSTASGVAFDDCPVGGNISSGTAQTPGRLTKFDSTTNQITDSIVSESGTEVTVAGTLLAGSLQGGGAAITNLNAGNISTGTLSVARGGTGQVSFVANSILLGNGTAGLGALTPGANGDCLMIVGGAPAYSTCTGAGGVSSVNTGTGVLTLQGANGVTVSTAVSGVITITGPTIGSGVTSVNGLSGALTVADATQSGSTITINTATATVRGIASYNSDNLVVNSGVVNTIQGIGTSAAPTFGGLSLQSASASLSGVGTNGTTTLQFATQSGNDIKTITIPNTSGTIAVSASGPLNLAADGVLSCATCLTSGGGGGSSGVESVNALTGALTINGANGITVSQAGTTITVTGPNAATGVSSLNGETGDLTVANTTTSGTVITIDNASTTAKGIASFSASDFDVSAGAVSLLATVTKQGNDFNGAGQLLQLNGSGLIPALNGSLLTNLDADNIASGTLAVAQGGTGTGSFTANGVLYGNGTSIGSTPAGTTGQCLVATTGGAPSFQTCTGAGGVSALNSQTGSVSIQNGTGISVSTSSGVITVGNTGVTSLLGTTNQIAVSSSTGAITLSLPQDINTGAAVQFSTAVLSGASSLTLGQGSSVAGSVTFKNGSNNFNTVLQSGTPSGNLSFTLPSADGSSGQCLTTNASGVLSFANCLTGASGGSAGVSSLQGATSGSTISGAITINNAASSGSAITIDNATTSAKGIASFSATDFDVASGAVTLDTIVTKAGNSFNGASQLLQLNGSGYIPALNGSLLTNLNAGNIASGILAIAHGGTGANSFTTNGVIYGNGTSLASTAVGTTGQCLVATTGAAPSFQTCTGAGGVSSLQGGTTGSAINGAITINNAASSGSAITIDNATTSAKGIASFSATDFGVASGAVTLNAVVTKAGNSFNGASQLVQLDSSSRLAALDASQLTNINASNIATGTLDDGRLSGNVARRDLSNTFSGQTNTFNSDATSQDGLVVNANSLTTGNGLKVATSSTGFSGGDLLEVSQSSAYGGTFSSSSKLLNVNRNITGVPAPGLITLDSFSSGMTTVTGSCTVTFSINHTVSGSNRALITSFTTNNLVLASATFTVGGVPQAMTKLSAWEAAGNAMTSVWVLANPAAGVGTVSASYTIPGCGSLGPGGSNVSATVSSWNGVNTSSAFGTPAMSSWTTSQTSASVTATTTAGQQVVDIIARHNGTGSITPGAGQTLVGEDSARGTSQTRELATSTSTTMSGSWSSAAFRGAIFAVPLNPLTVAGTVDGILTGSVANIASSCLGCTETSSILNLQQSNTLATGAVLSLQNSGLGADIQLSSGILRNAADSVAALRIQNSAGSETLFTADTTNNRIKIGDGAGATATTLVLDSAASDPAGVNGAMYYSTDTNTFRCYANGAWAGCSTGVALSGTATDGRLVKFNSTGQVMNSNLAESGTTDKTLTYTGNLLVNGASGYTGNLLDIQLNGVNRLSVSNAGNLVAAGTINGASITTTSINNLAVSGTAITGSGGALTISSATNTDLTLQGGGTGVVAVADHLNLSSGSEYRINNASINTAGTLSNVAYENQANIFTEANTFRNTSNSANAFRIQNASSVDVLNVNTTDQTINIGGSAKTYSSGTGYTYGSGYAARANYTIAGSYTTAYADFNGDGYKDYVRSNTTGNLISMMLNNGNATFASATSIATGMTTLGDIAAGDLDGDGDQDIAVVRGTNVSVLKNNGTGTFAAATNYAAGSTLVQLTIFDVDNDGDRDVVGVSGAVDALVVLKNNGTGTLAAASTYPTFSDAYSAMVTFGDVDNDGDQDVALMAGDIASVFKNNGTGAFTVRNDYGSAGTVALADLDNDGDKDLIVSGGSAMPGVRLNDGSGNFGAVTNYSLTGNHYNQAVVGNLDDDANPDIAFTGMYMDVIGYGLVEGNGSGGVSAVTGLSDFYDGDSFTGTTDVDLVDLDVDGDDDLVFSLTDGTIRVHKNNYILGGSPVVSVSSTTSITASSSDKAALLLQGASGQSVDILRVQGSSVTPYFRVANNGKVGIGAVSSLESSTYGLNVQGGVAVTGDINISAGGDYLIDGVSITTGGTLANVAYLDYDNEFTGVTNSFNSAATTGYALAVNADSATSGGALQVSTTSGQLLSGNFIDINQASQYANNYSTTNTLLNVSRTVGTQDITATISQIGTVSSGYSTSSANAGQQYFTFSHNVPNTGSNRVLFVAVGSCYNTMTVTYNGVAMTKYPTTGTNATGGACNGNDTGGTGTVSYYYLVNPSTGTNTVAVTTGSANSQYAGAIAMTFQNVNQTTPINNAAAGNPATVNVRSYEVGLDVYLGTAGGSYNPVPGGSQIMQGSVINAGPFRMGASKTPVSGTTISQMSWTPVNASIWDHMAIRLNPAVIPGVGSASGNLVSFTNSCDAGTCGDTTTLLNLNQTVAQSTGSVLNIQNAGTGYSLQVGGNTSIFSGQQNGYNAAAATLLVGRNSTTLRSINAAGAIGASGADYAEWIPWTGAKPAPGSVVVYKGSTFIVSSLETAAIVGNDKIDTDNAILVAFSGQLPVKVTGAVHEGDLLISNGDGTAKAVPASEATLADYANRVGIAWETNLDPGVKKIIGAVGTSAAGMVSTSALQGTGSFASLNVTGNVTIGGDLTVSGLTTVGDIAISGHIITTGGQPTDELQPAAGTGAVITIDGNDTLGTITITTGSAPTAGAVSKVIFSELYGKAPRVVLSASDENAAGMRFYKGVTTADGFMLNFKDAPAANTTYTFDYFIGE